MATSTTSINITTNISGLILAESGGNNTLGGTFYIQTTGFDNRVQELIIEVGGNQDDYEANLSIPINRSFNDWEVMTNFQIGVGSLGEILLVCDVGNLNSSTGSIDITWVGDGEQIPVLAPTNTITSYLPRDSVFGQEFIACNNSSTEASFPLTLIHSMVPGNTAGNDIGVGMLFQHQQASGGIIDGAAIYTDAPGSASNNQNTSMIFQTNNGSGLVNSLVLSSSGITVSSINLTNASGTFTPSLTFGGSSTGITYDSQIGHYVKIGPMVYCNIQLDLSNKGSSSGAAVINGLPFTVANVSIQVPVAAFNTSLSSGYTTFLLSLTPNGTTGTVAECGNNVNLAAITNTNCTNSSAFRCTFVYQAA